MSGDKGWACIDCKVNDLVDSRGGSQYQPEARVLLCELDERADLNGTEGFLVSATQSEEKKLRRAQLLKVRVGDETLVVPLNNVIVGTLPAIPLKATRSCSMRCSSHGLGVFAVKDIGASTPVLVEHPLVAINSHPMAWLDHPQIGPLIEQVTVSTQNHKGSSTNEASPKARKLVDEILSIQASEAFERMSESVRHRLMSLHGVLSHRLRTACAAHCDARDVLTVPSPSSTDAHTLAAGAEVTVHGCSDAHYDGTSGTALGFVSSYQRWAVRLGDGQMVRPSRYHPVPNSRGRQLPRLLALPSLTRTTTLRPPVDRKTSSRRTKRLAASCGPTCTALRSASGRTASSMSSSPVSM